MSITLELINKRKRMLENDTQSINRPNINSIQSPINLNIMETFLSSINNSVDVNYFGTTIFDKYMSFCEDNVDNPDHIKKVQNIIKQNIIPVYKNMEQLDNYTKDRQEMQPFANVIDDYMICDRVIKNDRIINNRFDVDRFIKGNINMETAELVHSLCEFIDTYTISTEAKMNLALENISYSINRNKSERTSINEIDGYIADYFLLRESVLTDTYMRKMERVFDRSIYSYALDKPSLPFTQSDHYFGKKICEALDISMDTVRKLDTEKKVSEFITENVTIDQEQAKVDAILALPLAINISQSFMEAQLLNISSLSNTTNDLRDRIEENKKQYKNGLSSLHFLESIQIEEQEKVQSFAELLESEMDNEDIKEFFKKYKSEQVKDTNWFKRMMASLYKKKPSEIIDGFPHLLGMVRAIFILAPIAVPYVGPILSLINVCVDKMISIDINKKEATKLYKAISNEKKLMEDKLEGLDGDKKKKTDLYVKDLNKCMEKVQTYTSDEHDNYIDDDDDGDDFSFDFGLESYINNEHHNMLMVKEADLSNMDEEELLKEFMLYQESLSNIFEKKDLINKYIYMNLDTICERSLYTISNIISHCPNTVDYRWFSNEAMDYMYDTMGDPMACDLDHARHTLREAINDVTDAGTMRNVIIESECVNTLYDLIQEGFSMNNVKLALQNMKSKVKDLSTKEKSISQSIDAHGSTLLNGIEKAIRSDRRESIIKGSIIPSFSRAIKLTAGITAVSIVNPVLGLISAMGYFGTSKYLNRRERLLIYDEIDTELHVVEKEIQMAENDGDMKKLRFMLQYQKKLAREKQRIKYGIRSAGQRIPTNVSHRNDD